jgi:hypothetical protein
MRNIMAIRSGKNHPNGLGEKSALQLINQEFTSSKDISKEAIKIAEQRQLHNENVEIEAARQADPEARKEDRRYDLAGKAAILITAAALAPSVANTVSNAYHRVVHGAPIAKAERIPEAAPKLQPLTESINTDHIAVNQETFKNMRPQEEITVRAGDTPSEIVERQAPQLLNTPAGNEMQQSFAPEGELEAGDKIKVANPGVEIQPAQGSEPAIRYDLNPNK